MDTGLPDYRQEREWERMQKIRSLETRNKILKEYIKELYELAAYELPEHALEELENIVNKFEKSLL